MPDRYQSHCALQAAATLTAITLLSAGALLALPETAEGPCDFTFAHDPTSVVLFVQSSGSSTGEVRSMTLFGDGRLELVYETDPQLPGTRRNLSLSEAQMEALLGSAVKHGLAEWDATRIESEKLVATGGKAFASRDGSVVTVSIALTSLRRGDWEAKGVQKTMQVASPDLAARFFPQIEELAGVAELERYLVDAFSRPASR